MDFLKSITFLVTIFGLPFYYMGRPTTITPKHYDCKSWLYTFNNDPNRIEYETSDSLVLLRYEGQIVVTPYYYHCE